MKKLYTWFAGTIVTSLGTRYASYCSNVARTYLVDPTPKMQGAYKALLAAQVRPSQPAHTNLKFV